MMAKVIDKIAKNSFVSVTIALDFDEAKALYDMLRNTGGSPTYSRRKHTDRIIRELRELFPSPYKVCTDLSGSMHFKDSL